MNDLVKIGTAAQATLEIHDPTGALEVNQLHAPRLADLSGTTVCELSNGMWEHDRTFTLIRKLLKKRPPGIKIIPYTEFPILTRTDPDVFIKLLKEKGADGAIVGNAA